MPRRGNRLMRRLAAALAAGAAAGAATLAWCNAAAAAAAAPAGDSRVEMRVLVVTDGSVSVEAIRQQLGSEGVPMTTLDTHDASRPPITSAFLSATLPGGTQDGHFQGAFGFEGAPGGPASYGYIARPASPAFTPYLTAAIPGTSGAGTLAGVYTGGGREQLEISFGYSYHQLQYRYIAPAVTDWVTKGVHFGYWRNYLTVDYDDVFNANAEWSPAGHCTPGADPCPLYVGMTKPTRMTPADVRYAVAWQKQHTLTLEFLFNGGASARFQVHGTDPLLTAFKPVARQFWWINHTYSHDWLGCTQDFTVTPWRCSTDGGQTQYVGEDLVQSQIQDNVAWAKNNGIPMSESEFAPGEYSGLRLLPQQPDSGACQAAGPAACLKPFDLKTGWDTGILPVQVRTMFGGMLENDPRPFFMHQSNLTGDRLGYPVMDGALSDYTAVFSGSAPIVNQRLSAAGATLHAQDTWARELKTGAVSGYIQGNSVTITGAAGTRVPVTVPDGTTISSPNGTPAGSPYAGQRSGYQVLGARPLTLWLTSAPQQSAGGG